MTHQFTIFDIQPEPDPPPAPPSRPDDWIDVDSLTTPPSTFQIGDRVRCTVRFLGNVGTIVSFGHPILGDAVAMVRYREGADPYPCRFENLLHAD